MAGEWKLVALGEVGSVVTGRTPPGTLPEYFGNEIPFLTPSDMDGRRKVGETTRFLSALGINALQKLIVPRGVAVSCIGWQMGKAVLIDQRCATNQQINTLIPRSDCADDLFVYYAISAQRETIFRLGAGGSRTPILNKTGFERFQLLLPPLPEQKAIATILGALDDKIELNRRTNATLEAIARALFQSWFVDFDPVRAKLDGRQPPGLDPATAAPFPDSFEHSELGMIPKNWKRTKVRDMAKINSLTLAKTDLADRLEYVEISEVNRGDVLSTTYYQRGTEPSRARRRLRDGDTVLSTVRPDRGAYFLALEPPANRVASTGFAVVTPDSVPWSFLHTALTLPEVFSYLGQMADGGAYPAVRPEVIGEIVAVVPNERAILDDYHKTTAPLFRHIEKSRLQSRTLAALRDTLLPKLLSGELRLPEFAKKIEAAL